MTTTKTSRQVNQPSPKSSEKRERGPSLQWTSHLSTEDQRNEFIQLMGVSGSPVTRRLLEIVQLEKAKTQDTILSLKNYDSPSWALIQADNIGYNRALRLVELLLKDIVK